MADSCRRNSTRVTNEQWKLPWYHLDGASGTLFTDADTTPAVSARDYATVAALTNTQIIYVPYGVDKLELRMMQLSPGGTPAFDILAARGQDVFTRCLTMTWEAGTQSITIDSVPYYFGDTIAITNDDWGGNWNVHGASGENYIGRLYLNTLGYDYFAFVPTVNAVDNFLQWSGLSS